MAESPATDDGRTRTFLLAVIMVILVGWALKATYLVTMPLALAFFVAIILRPLQIRLYRGLPRRLRFLSLGLTVLVLVLVLLLLAALVGYSFELVLQKAPAYAEAGSDLWVRLQGWAHRRDIPVENLLPPVRQLASQGLGLLTTGFSRLWWFTLLLVLLFFLVLLMLQETEEWETKLEQGLGPHRASEVVDTVRSVEVRVRQFLLIKTLISALSGLASGLWLWLLGVDLAVLWGLLIFVLNFIPNIGSIIAVIPPALVALLQLGPGHALLAIGGMALFEQILGNLVGPRMEGRTLSISPMVVLVSIVFWGWVWGFIGALIGVLLTTTLIIICDHIPALRPMALLLSRPAQQQGAEAGGGESAG